MNEEIMVGVSGRVKSVVNDDDSMQFVTFRIKESQTKRNELSSSKRFTIKICCRKTSKKHYCRLSLQIWKKRMNPRLIGSPT